MNGQLIKDVKAIIAAVKPCDIQLKPVYLIKLKVVYLTL